MVTSYKIELYNKSDKQFVIDLLKFLNIDFFYEGLEFRFGIYEVYEKAFNALRNFSKNIREINFEGYIK